MAELVYDNDRHIYIGEDYEIEEKVVKDYYEWILSTTPAHRHLESVKREALLSALNEGNYTPSMKGVRAIGVHQ